MDVIQLKCVVAVADELHFGRAARSLDMLPASLGRHIRRLEDALGVPLFERTTRTASLTAEGQIFVIEARRILQDMDRLEGRFLEQGRVTLRPLRVGAIDSASAGLVPDVLAELHAEPDPPTVILTEDKTIRLIPKLLAGSLDLVIFRPGASVNPRLVAHHLAYETPVFAIATSHQLAARGRVTMRDIADVPMIVPERRSRPHSHDLTIKLFEENGLVPGIAQIADEKQTILSMVSAGIGGAIVPRWSARMIQAGVAFCDLADLSETQARRLPLAIAWPRHIRDAERDRFVALARRMADGA